MMYLCFCAVLVREVDYCLCNMTAHVQSFSTHTLSDVNTVNAFNRYKVVASAHWKSDLSKVQSKKIDRVVNLNYTFEINAGYFFGYKQRNVSLLLFILK